MMAESPLTPPASDSVPLDPSRLDHGERGWFAGMGHQDMGVSENG